jgi:hypothetical protein
VVACVACAGSPPAATAPPAAAAPPAATAPLAATPIPLQEAREQIARAAALCGADHGALWNVSLCGPMMLVDRQTRFVVANQADATGALHAEAGVFIGTLPADENIANTATTWAGVHWVQLGWPLPAEQAARDTMMMHEMFHRIAERIGIHGNMVDNPQLATLDGRYYLQLEWRALASALRATTDAERRRAVRDALAFRRARRAAFPGSAATEDALELHEGLAEYTGIVVGRPGERDAAALRDLATYAAVPSFVRSFAYATGPSYGLLLDRYAPGWRATIAQTHSLSDLLAAAIGGLPADAEPAAARYDGAALRLAEQAATAAKAATLAEYHRALVDGPVLKLAIQDMKISFNPREVQPLGALGTVYPTLRVVDVWGVLEVTGRALVAPDWKTVTVPAPPTATAHPLTGDGWSLELAPGWSLEPDARAGDLRLRHAGG